MKKTIYTCDVCHKIFKPLPFESFKWLSLFVGGKRIDFCPKCKHRFTEFLDEVRDAEETNK